jgi:uncharacterized membrane protein YfcA
MAYVSGSLALLVVVIAVVSAVFYALTHNSETIRNLATSTLSGIGMAIGGCIGSALILRFKAARTFIRHLLDEILDGGSQ